MSGSQIAFLAIGGIGFLVLLFSFILGEVEHDVEMSHELEVDHDFDSDGYMPAVFSLKIITAAMVGFGAFGYVSSAYGLPDIIAWPLALIGSIAVGAGTFFLVLKPLARQQSNSVLSRDSYRGMTAKVTLGIAPAKPGIVSFHDLNGAFVSQRAELVDEGTAITGSEVFIVDITQSGVTVMPSTISKEETE